MKVVRLKSVRGVALVIAACAIGASACDGAKPSSAPASASVQVSASASAPAIASSPAGVSPAPEPSSARATATATAASGVHITVVKTEVPIPNGNGAKATIDEPTAVGVPAAVTARLRAAATDDLASFGAQIPHMGCGTNGCNGCSAACATPTFNAQWINGRADEHVVSGRWVFTTYYPGAAHPYDAYQSLIVDAQTGQAIDPWALFESASLTPLADAAKPLLLNAVNGRDGCAVSTDTFAQQAFDSGVAPKPENYQAVAVVSSGLSVAIEPGQISSEACGGFQATVPWSSMKSALNAFGVAIADGQPLPKSGSDGSSASGVAQCKDGEVVVSVLMTPATGAAGLSHQGVLLQFTPIATSACTLYGYPGVAGLDFNGKQLIQAKRTLSGYLGGVQSKPDTVTITPLSPASAWAEGSSATQPGTSCPDVVALLVTPPGLHNSTQVEAAPAACGGLQVHPVVSGLSGSR